MRAAVAPLYLAQLKQAEDVRVVRRLVELDLHELNRVRIDTRRRLADEREDVIQRVLLGPAQHIVGAGQAIESESESGMQGWAYWRYLGSALARLHLLVQGLRPS